MRLLQQAEEHAKRFPQQPLVIHCISQTVPLLYYTSICSLVAFLLLPWQQVLVPALALLATAYFLSRFLTSKHYVEQTFAETVRYCNYFAKQFDKTIGATQRQNCFVLATPTGQYDLFFATVQGLMKNNGRELVFATPSEMGIKNYITILQQWSSTSVCVTQPLFYVLIQVLSVVFAWRPLKWKQIIFVTHSKGLAHYILGFLLSAQTLVFDAAQITSPVEYTSPVPEDEEAASTYVNTTGATGVPKMVALSHGNLNGQAEALKHAMQFYAHVKTEEVRPTFITHNIVHVMSMSSMGVTTLIPDGIPIASPGQVDVENVLQDMHKYKPLFALASPIVWIKMIDHMIEKKLKFPESLKFLFSGGAPVPVRLHELVHLVSNNEETQLCTPYGATECLPMCVIGTHELTKTDALEKIKQGYGACVGMPCHGVNITIDESVFDDKFDSFVDSTGKARVGEIVVQGPNVSKRYHFNDEANEKFKFVQHGKVHHRTGDVGYIDAQGRVWYCGRKVHCVLVDDKYIVPSVNVEGVINVHHGVRQSAFVHSVHGPCVIIELMPAYLTRAAQVIQESKQLLEQCKRWSFLLQHQVRFLIHEKLPTDPRHNSKIDRAQLSVWASTH